MSLVVVDIVGDVDDEQWKRLCSSVRQEDGDSKVVIICRTAEHATCLGTAPRAVMLDYLRRPELLYFFRVLAFGGANLEDRPELVAAAVDVFDAIIASGMSLFATEKSVATLLRADMTLRSWRRIAQVLGKIRRPPQMDDSYILRPSMDAPRCLFYAKRKLAATSLMTCGGGDEWLPTMKDLLTGRVVPTVDMPRFDVLMCKSSIPPYCTYVRTCEMVGDQRVLLASGRKRVERRWSHGNSEQDEWLKKKRTVDEC